MCARPSPIGGGCQSRASLSAASRCRRDARRDGRSLRERDTHTHESTQGLPAHNVTRADKQMCLRVFASAHERVTILMRLARRDEKQIGHVCSASRCADFQLVHTTSTTCSDTAGRGVGGRGARIRCTRHERTHDYETATRPAHAIYMQHPLPNPLQNRRLQILSDAISVRSKRIYIYIKCPLYVEPISRRHEDEAPSKCTRAHTDTRTHTHLHSGKLADDIRRDHVKWVCVMMTERERTRTKKNR